MIEPLQMGARKWEKWKTKLCKPFIQATVKYFDASGVDAAWAWLREAA